MQIRTTLTRTLFGMTAIGAMIPAMVGATGLQRNQAALAMAPNRACTPQVAKAPALRKQCALRRGGQDLQDDTTTGGSNIGPYVVGGVSALIVGGGVIIATDNNNNNDDDDTSPISS